MSQKASITGEAKEELESIAADMTDIARCLEVLENSLFFANDRKDKDMTKPCAAAAEAIIKMVDKCQDRILELIDA